jgi:dGTPase
LLRLGLTDDEFSFNLTFPTIATVIKYPKCSLTGNQGNKNGISYKKFGYYQCDKEKYQEINETLNLKNERHPLCFLLEAADDVCYSVSDIEDGFKKGTINTNILKKTLQESFRNDPLCVELCELVKSWEFKYDSYKNKEDLIAQKTRIFAHSKMIDAAIETFTNNHELIMAGTYQKELIEDSPAAALRKFFDTIATINFNSAGVLTRELAGEEVLCYLLKRFYNAVISSDCNKPKTTDGKLYSLISYQFKSAMDKTDYPNKDYLRILLLIDYISGMTDNYALTMYKELKGIS